MKSLLSFAIVLGLGVGSYAQGGQDEVIDFDSVGRHAVAVVQDRFLISEDAGLTWQTQSRGITCAPEIPFEARRVALSPGFAEDGTTFLSCAGQVFRSTNAGQHYNVMSELPTEVADLIVSPEFTVDDTLLARLIDGTLYVSVDAGGSWEPAQVDGLTALTWVPGLILAGGKDGRLYHSVDTIDWTASALVSAAPITAVAVPFTAGLEMPLLVGTENGLALVRLDEETAVLERHLNGRRITALASQPGGEIPALLAATWEDGIHRSLDWGSTWERAPSGLQISGDAVAIDRPQTGVLHAHAEGMVFAGAQTGLYRSLNAGERWVRAETIAGQITALAISPPTDGGYELAAVTQLGGIVRSADQGQSWIHDQAGLGDRHQSLAYGPGHGLYSGGPDRLAATLARGETWAHTPLPKLKSLETKATPTTIAVSSDGGTMFLGLNPSGLLKSTDLGQSYEVVLETHRIGALALSPNYALDGTIFADAGGALIRSIDAGATWDRLDVDTGAPISLAISPSYVHDGLIFAAGSNGLHWSEDRGVTWADVALPGGAMDVAGLAISPDFARDGRIYVQLLGQDLWLGTLGEGGFSWSTATFSDGLGSPFAPHGGDLFAFSPLFAEDQTLYGHAGQLLLRSSDAGVSWQVMPALPRRYEVEFDQIADAHVPVTTQGAWSWAPAPETFTQATLRKLGNTWRRAVGGAVTRPGNASGPGALSSDVPGAALTFDFVGRGVEIVATKGPDQGVAHILLDGQLFTSVDLYAPEVEYRSVVYRDHGMPLDAYELTIEVAGEQSDASAGIRVEIDAIDTFH